MSNIINIDSTIRIAKRKLADDLVEICYENRRYERIRIFNNVLKEHGIGDL